MGFFTKKKSKSALTLAEERQREADALNAKLESQLSRPASSFASPSFTKLNLSAPGALDSDSYFGGAVFSPSSLATSSTLKAESSSSSSSTRFEDPFHSISSLSTTSSSIPAPEPREVLSLTPVTERAPKLRELQLDLDDDDDTPLSSLVTRFTPSRPNSAMGSHSHALVPSGASSAIGGSGSGLSSGLPAPSRPGSAMGATVPARAMRPPQPQPQPQPQQLPLQPIQPVATGGLGPMAYPPPGVDAFLYASLPNEQKLALHQRSGQMMAMMQHAALTARAESVIGPGHGQRSVSWDTGSARGSQLGVGRPGSSMAMNRPSRENLSGSMSVSSGMSAMGMPGMAGMGGMGAMGLPMPMGIPMAYGQQPMMHPMMMHHQSMFNLNAAYAGGYGGFPQQQPQHNQFLPAFAPQFGVDPWAQGSMIGMPAHGGSSMGGSLGRKAGPKIPPQAGRATGSASTMSAAVRRR